MRRLTTLACATALAFTMTACGGDAEPSTIAVTGSDFTFAGIPDEIVAGSTLTFTNTAETELHELVAVRLPADETRSVEELLGLPPEELAAFFPGVATVMLQPPGSDDVILAEGDGTLTDPGRYLFLCAIPTGVDPQVYLEAAAQTEGGPPAIDGAGPPHFVQGMWAEAIVVAAG